MHVITVRRGTTLAGVLPLRLGRGSVSSPTNLHTPSFGPVVADPDAARELAEQVWERHPRRVSLAFVGSDDPLLAEMCDAARKGGYRTLDSVIARSPYVVTEGDHGSYEAGLDTKMLRSIHSRRSRLEAMGALSLEILDGSQRLDALLDEGFRIESSGWKAEEGTAILSHPFTTTFYTDVARWAAERGWLRLVFLRLDGRPIVFAFGVEHAGKWYVLKGGYDPEFGKYGPNKIVVRNLIASAFATELRRFEFLGGIEAWKLEWTDRVHERVLFQAFARTPAGLADWATFAYAKPMAKRALAKRRR